jgi:hypothetical protein
VLGAFFVGFFSLAKLGALPKFEALFAPIPQTKVWGYK